MGKFAAYITDPNTAFGYGKSRIEYFDTKEERDAFIENFNMENNYLKASKPPLEIQEK